MKIKLKLLTIFLLICLNCFSQDTIHRYNNVWHTRKISAYNAAELEKKDIIFIQGNDACGWTQRAMQNISKDPLYSILNPKYIFWYCNQDSVFYIYSEHIWSRTDYPHLPPYRLVIPTICVVQYDRPDYPILRLQGGISTTVDTLMIVLPNEIITYNDADAICFYDKTTLIIQSKYENEPIFIFTLSGKCLFILQKTSKTFYKTIYLPKGIYLVSGRNWGKKIIVN
jgi:hypothetical protein